MSSIYRKGRDGYFYYQAYVRNPETGKKDKKIFHALRTKDRLVAEEEKLLLDNKYNSKNEKYNFLNTIIKFPKIFSISIVVILSFYFFKNYFESNPFQKHQKTNEDINTIISDNEELIDTNQVVKMDGNILEQDKLESNNQEVLNEAIGTKEEDFKIPNYIIERKEKISGPFNQVKIFITVKKDAESLALRKICEIVSGQNNEFSNLIICIYENNKVGKQIASGELIYESTKKQNESWLAMYTYNPVEGEYFDDNPAGYTNND